MEAIIPFPNLCCYIASISREQLSQFTNADKTKWKVLSIQNIFKEYFLYWKHPSVTHIGMFSPFDYQLFLHEYRYEKNDMMQRKTSPRVQSIWDHRGKNMRKNPIYKHEILKSVHRIARRGLSGHSINMTAMIQRKKNRYLVLKVWQQLAGFESSLNLAAASSVLPVRKTFTDLHRVIILLPLL